MQNSFFFKNTIFFMIVLFIVTAIGVNRNVFAEPIPSEKRINILIQTMDSLEVEKQIKKRNGESIVDLEEKTSGLRDSVRSLRLAMQVQTKTPVADAPKKFSMAELKQMFFKARSIFDWIVIGAGALAIFAFFVLLIGMFRTLFKKPVRPPILPATVRQRALPSSEPQSGVRKGTISSSKSEESTDTLTRLRQRVIADTAKVPSRMASVAAASYAANTTEKVNDSDKDIHNQVLEAVQKGIEVKEISRQLHIPADQVTLIIKMAKL
jgi:hypothetical protein